MDFRYTKAELDARGCRKQANLRSGKEFVVKPSKIAKSQDKVAAPKKQGATVKEAQIVKGRHLKSEKIKMKQTIN